MSIAKFGHHEGEDSPSDSGGLPSLGRRGGDYGYGVSEPGNAIEILTQDRDVWKARCLAAEARVAKLEALHIEGQKHWADDIALLDETTSDLTALRSAARALIHVVETSEHYKRDEVVTEHIEKVLALLPAGETKDEARE